LSTSIPVSIETQLMLKELKLRLEKKLMRIITWDEFFNKIEIKIDNTDSGKMGKK
jgi:hypothetical protein